MTGTKKIVLFDGVCNLCNYSVTLIIKKDKKDIFRFAALQSEIGRHLIQKYHIDTSKLDSILLIEGKYYTYKSTAALRIAKYLKGWYSLFYVFIIVPPIVRNFFYDIIAKNRYKWFGKKESCMIPTPELKAKFLE
ncbi:MAG: thiol-disulfide oxidoreductase [Flavobacteriaceae bacterium CG2_30_34_30]|nr:MAG: thiol-disulfide oxidoreductase [Flavobacteriaceae bacterium CG2_30_34_30]